MLASAKQFVNRPNAIRQPRFHCGRLAVFAVDPAEVEMGDEEREGMFQVFELL
jgi:hypothetical protein